MDRRATFPTILEMKDYDLEGKNHAEYWFQLLTIGTAS